MQINTFLITSIIFVFSLQSCEKKANTEFKISADYYFNEIVDKLEIPGMGVTIVRGDETLLDEGYGYADIENKLSSTSNSAYYIASSTKSFTALLAIILDHEGIIKLDDSIENYFPDLQLDSVPDYGKIKIRDLLTHTSGIDNDPIGWRVAFTGDHNQAMLEELMKYCSTNDVGYGNYQYTNSGYNIYAVILEKVTGKSWKDWLHEKIFAPAGMDHTTAYISKAEKENWVLAKPYMVLDTVKRIELEKKDNTMQSAGGLITTPKDMSIWLKLQIGKGKLNGQQIIPESIMTQAQQRLVETAHAKRIFEPTHYGMGWLFGKYEEETVIHHFGGFPGFSTHVSFMPEKQIGIAVMVNEAFVGSRLMNMIATEVYDILLADSDSIEFNYENLNSFVDQAKKGRAHMLESIERRNERKWMLSKEFIDYSGIFTSEEYGTIVIDGDAEGMNIIHGNMQCRAEPYERPESFRIELLPLSGEVIQMIIENEQVVGLIYDGVTFTTIDSLKPE